ncbi:MAG: ParB/RepB/Spo0J family partition protein [Pikeienuella sp.]
MAENKRKKGLGRGLAALMDDVAAPLPGQPAASAESTAPIEKIHPNPEQPRRIFKPREMEELTSSIREKGIIQPLLVRPDPKKKGHFQIVAGERRWRAAQLAKVHEAPIIVRDLDDAEVLEIAIIENVQRADLNPIEEAQGYRQLIDRFGHSQALLADRIGKSRSYIANALRLLALPEDVQDHLVDGRLSIGHARAIITAHNPSELAREVIAKGLSVRQTEALAKQIQQPKGAVKRAPAKDADTRALEGDLSAALGLKVSIAHKGAKGGELKISYKDLEQLDGLCRLLNQ